MPEVDEHPLSSENQKYLGFEEYQRKPFTSFANVEACEVETEEKIFIQFKQWISQDTEGFLYTFEPRPDLFHLNLGKCPYFHTGKTWKESLDKTKLAERESSLIKEFGKFLRKRFRLIQRLLEVFKKAKEGIESEYQKDLMRKDPYCKCKRKIATKRIVDMMIKQFALEYLYLKSIKIKKEIEHINCILIDSDRVKHLKNIHKYVLRTAEKLRCLLEKECADENEKYEEYFAESTLRDMARMYLNEVENMTASPPQLVPEESVAAEIIWEGTATEEAPSTIEGSNLHESNPSVLHEDMAKEISSTSEIRKIILEDSDESSKQDENVDNEETIHPIQISKKVSYKLSELELFAEGHHLIDDVRREILKSEYSIKGEYSIFGSSQYEVKEDEIEKEDPRVALLEANKAEIEMLEEFKRELWIIQSFRHFTKQIRPELSDKYKLIHSGGKFNHLVIPEFDSNTDENGSTVDNDLNECLTYLNQIELASKNKSEMMYSVNPQRSISAYSNFNTEEETTSEFKYSKQSIEETIQSPLPNLTEASSNIISLDGDIEENIDSNWHVEEEQTTARSSRTSGQNVNTPLNEEGTLDKSEFLTRSHDNRAGSDATSISRGFSIPSFCGSYPDPLKNLRKCALRRSLQKDEVDFDTSGPDEETENRESQEVLEPCIDSLFKKSKLKGLDENKEPLKSFEESEQVIPRSIYGDNRSRLDDRSKCFPSLMDVLDHFTKTLKGESISLCKNMSNDDKKEVICRVCEEVEVEEIEGIEEDEECYEKPLLNWEELLYLKWPPPIERAHKIDEEPIRCQYDTTEVMERLRKSNLQYMRNHPEIAGLVSLILREFSIKRPKNDFVKFIRDIIFNKHFAQQLTSYLTINNKEFRRRNGINNECPVDCMNQDATERMFKFNPSSTSCWRQWGVDYNKIHQEYRQNNISLEAEMKSSSSGTNITEMKDSWNIRLLIRNSQSNKGKSQIDGKTNENLQEFTPNFKDIENECKQDFEKEIGHVTALAREEVFDPDADIRSSCQKLYSNSPLKRSK